jgi:hypothetical protein
VTDEELTAEIAGMLVRIEKNYLRETSAPGTRFEGLTLESVQAEAVIRRVRERLYEQLGNEHYVIFTENGWSTEHSVECRLSGHMHECAYHAAIGRVFADQDPEGTEGWFMLGRWKITGISDGVPDLERAEMPS